MLKRKPKLRADSAADAITRQISEAQRKRLVEAPMTPERSGTLASERQYAPCLRRRQKKFRSRAAALLDAESSSEHQVLQRLDFAVCSDDSDGAAAAENEGGDGSRADALAFDALEDQENKTPPPAVLTKQGLASSASAHSAEFSTAKRRNGSSMVRSLLLMCISHSLHGVFAYILLCTCS